MTSPVPATMQRLQSLVDQDGRVRVGLVEVPVPQPRAHEVLIRVEATPINPSDLGMLFAGADLAALETGSRSDHPEVSAPLSPGARAAAAGRVGQGLPAGNEGAGVVVAAGADPDAQALVGRTVAGFGGGMYAEYRCLPAASCLPLPEGTPARAGASCFVNPLTALGMVETMRLEGHTALVHTAAASNLGQMLHRICEADGVPLVNVVRRSEQVELLAGLGARHICNTSAPGFADHLVDVLVETGATIAFDAIGGGELPSRLLSAMEAAVNARASGSGEYSRYGSTVFKQVYIYGGLDRGPTLLTRTYGMAWGVSGWLLPNFLAAVGPEVADRLRARVVDELTTTFASHYSRTVSLAQMVDPEVIAVYSRLATGEKFLVEPHA